MRSLILFCSILHISFCGLCPTGYDLVSNGQCRGYKTSTTLRNDQKTDKAIEICDGDHAIPVSIHNNEEQSYWTNLASTSARSIILGLKCDTNSTKWKWSDGSVMDFKPPSGQYNTDLDKSCANGCVWWINSGNKQWARWCDNTNENIHIYCTTQLALPTTDGCDNFEDDNDDDICYLVGDVAENWQDAQLSCRKLGANLASIHNDQENSFVRRLAVSQLAVNGVYLGATVSGKGGEFGWIDGSAWDYDHYFPGFPMKGFGDCVVMDTSTSSGQWMNIDCSALLPVACIRDKRSLANTTETCSTEPWTEGALITSPGFPYSSSTPCDYFLTVDSGKKVEVEIALLEANSCCDSLIIYDGYVGGIVLAKLTGEYRNTTYTTTTSNIMRVSWQPNGGNNVLGFAMTFRGV